MIYYGSSWYLSRSGHLHTIISYLWPHYSWRVNSNKPWRSEKPTHLRQRRAWNNPWVARLTSLFGSTGHAKVDGKIVGPKAAWSMVRWSRYNWSLKQPGALMSVDNHLILFHCHDHGWPLAKNFSIVIHQWQFTLTITRTDSQCWPLWTDDSWSPFVQKSLVL